MVVWLFAGGGHTELRLPPFFEKYFPACRFERALPVRERGPAMGGGMGHTGKSLLERVQKRLQEMLQHSAPPDIILILDDLDCRDGPQAEHALRATVATIPKVGATPLVIALAAPEIESWLLADWAHTFGQYSKFRARSQEMQHYLSTTGQVPFAQPETFSTYDPDKKSCREKLSDAIAEAACRSMGHFSKKEDTPALLPLLNPDIVSGKCPHFRKFWSALHDHCDRKKSPAAHGEDA